MRGRSVSGPRRGFDRLNQAARENARINDSYLSVLDKSFTRPPVALGVHCNEGPAVSRTRLHIAWTHDGQTAISAGDIVYEGSAPKLAHVKRVLDLASFPADRRPQRFIETQSFVPPTDRELTITAYEINGTASTEVFIVDLDTGALRNVSTAGDHYNEAEGIFPDGNYTTIERAPHQGKHWPMVDIYRLALDGSRTVERLTYFSDYRGYKANQSVVSDDGKFMMFQIGKAGAESGQGFGFFLYDFAKAKASQP